MSRVDELDPKMRQAVEHILRLGRDGFTGQLVLHFKDGVPQRGQPTETIHYTAQRAAVLDRRVGT